MGIKPALSTTLIVISAEPLTGPWESLFRFLSGDEGMMNDQEKFIEVLAGSDRHLLI